MTDTPPVLRVVRGAPTDEELAALVAVLTARAAAASGGPAASGPASTWNDHRRAVHAAPSPGPGAWRASALPG